MVNTRGKTVILVGHGGVPTDFSRDKVRRLMALEAQRNARGGEMSDEEASLDREIRTHPRSPETEPYKFGLEKLARALAPRLGKAQLMVAYNEFCAPSVPEAVANAADAGAREVVLITSMMTPGGSHSEIEIPELVEALRGTYPQLQISYAWPFDMERLADFMAQHLVSFSADGQDVFEASARTLVSHA